MKTLLSIFIIALSLSSFSQVKLDSIFIYFEVDESNSQHLKSNENAYQKIHSLVSSQKITFIGYTDTTGTDSYNLSLANRRINDVKTHINNRLQGVKTEVVGETSSFGNLANNRCVILVYEKSSKNPIAPIIKTLDTLILNLTFVNNKDILLPESEPVVQELYDLIDSTDFLSIHLHGHVCCGSGQTLSLDRAKKIQKYLIRHGVDARKIRPYGHSNLQPRFPEINEENKQKNRRVEVVIVVE